MALSDVKSRASNNWSHIELDSEKDELETKQSASCQ